MTYLHNIWQEDAERVSELRGCYKFQFKKSIKMADSRHLKVEKSRYLIMHNGSLKRIGRPPSWILFNSQSLEKHNC